MKNIFIGTSGFRVTLIGSFLLSVLPEMVFISMTFGTFSLQYHVAGVSQITGMAIESFGQVAGDSFLT